MTGLGNTHPRTLQQRSSTRISSGIHFLRGSQLSPPLFRSADVNQQNKRTHEVPCL